GGLADGSTYAVLEHVDWPTLAAGLTASGAPLPAEAFARQAGAILTSLGATHAKGVVHADLKPENIFLQALPARARLFDFGLARLAIGQDEEPLAAIEGTAEYMAPEQCVEGTRLDERADVYSAGVIFYEMLTGSVALLCTAAGLPAAPPRQRAPRPAALAA